MPKILCLCLSPAIQKTAVFTDFAAVQVNRADFYRTDASGKGVNSARVLNQLEPGSTGVICPLGRQNRAEFLRLLANDGLFAKNVTVPGKTRECLTLLDKTNCTTTEVILTEPAFSESEGSHAQKKLVCLVSHTLKKYDALIFSGSVPKGFSPTIIKELALVCKKSDKMVLADFCGNQLKDFLHVHTPEFIKINKEEFCKTFGITATTESELELAVAAKSAELKTTVIVTQGSKATLTANNGVLTKNPSESITPVNTTACGDSFNAGLIYEYLCSANLALALKKAVWCAARNAENIRPGSILQE